MWLGPLFFILDLQYLISHPIKIIHDNHDKELDNVHQLAVLKNNFNNWHKNNFKCFWRCIIQFHFGMKASFAFCEVFSDELYCALER